MSFVIKHTEYVDRNPRGNDDAHYSYLLGLLAMIKCSICSYQCDN